MFNLMAKTMNFRPKDFETALLDFSSLALGTHNATNEIMESQIQIASPEQAKQFHKQYTNYQQALRAKADDVFRNGVPSERSIKKVDETFRKYDKTRQIHEKDPSLAFLNDPIHRKEFDVHPYEIKGKHTPPNPYPGASAAMDGLWPGYDKEEYFKEYPFLERYRDKAPKGKVLEAFLRDHNLFFNFPETLSRYGVLFVPPPYLTDDLNVEVRQHLSKCDKLHHTAPTLTLNATVAEARLVLSYVEDDMVAVVVDEGGKCIGVIGWEDLEHLTEDDETKYIGKFYQRDWNEAPDGDMSAEQAFEYMDSKKPEKWNYMLKFVGNKIRIVTRTTASIAHFLPPHTFKEGLGSAIYFGISDIADGNRLINRLKTDADGVPAAIVETAHADTPYFRKILAHYRKEMQDVFLMAGTTIDPDAVMDFLKRYGADSVKLGIAEGTACRTSDTGIALPNAHVGLICGAEAYGEGHLALDGWGKSGEFIKGLSMTGIQMRQGGGAFVGRRESANPWLPSQDGKGRGKFYRGMAGIDVQRAVLESKDLLGLIKRMENAAHLHSEGAEVFVRQRSPSTLGRMLLAHMFLLKSAMSYSGVRAELADKEKIPASMYEVVMHQFQRMAELYLVQAKTAA